MRARRKSLNWVRLLIGVTLAVATPSFAYGETIWAVRDGRSVLALDTGALARLGVAVTAVDHAEAERGAASATVEWPVAPESNLTFVTVDGTLRAFLDGNIRHAADVRLQTAAGAAHSVAGFDVGRPAGAAQLTLHVRGDTRRAGGSAFELQDVKLGFDSVAGTLLIEVGEVVVARELAEALRDPELEGAVLGTLTLQASAVRIGGDEPGDSLGASAGADGLRAVGPDVIVGDLHEVGNYGSLSGISAFSVGTISCNQGDQTLKWVSSTNEHPVIAQNMYRLKNGRFEQVGMSWLKHGFTALAEDTCNLGCTPPGTGTLLGIGCSDPYSASLNGSQTRLGPRFEVNPYTGYFPYPFTSPSYSGAIARRLQVHNADLDPALSGGGSYFVEGQYVTADDAASGHQDNNASYRPIAVSGSGSSWTISLTGVTQQTRPALHAWKNSDSGVVETEVRVPGEGLFLLSARATSLGGGVWHYEYAVQNLTSDRAVGSFRIPVPSGATLSNVGFHDVDYHSGEPFVGTDWTPSAGATDLTWATETYAANVNANALRWGTLYNFRFDVDAPPQSTSATIGLFKPGTPSAVSALTVGPALGPIDCNSNGTPDDQDLAGGGSQDCNANGIPDECETFPPTPLRAALVVSGLSSPVGLTTPPGDFDRLFVNEQNTGRVRIIRGGAVLPTPFLDLGSLISSGGERGLLGVAFHPAYATNGHFFVDYTNVNGDTVIARYTVSGADPDVADAASAVILLTIAQDFANHNGGQLQFGPDGYLYVGMGDGGSGGDPNNRGQDPTSLLGKILRLDVDNPPTYVPPSNPFVSDPTTRDEIWALGTRNPWRFSFDRLTGDLYIADVGQNAHEEVNFQLASSPGGENYGWRCYEGNFPYDTSGCGPAGDYVFPILDVAHTDSGTCSITGGYVYRGCAMPDLAGTYFFADYCGGYVRSLQYRPGDPVPPPWLDRTAELGPLSGAIVSFGEDAAGELYIVTSGGNVYQIVPAGTAICGNHIIEAGEQCDDGNTAPGDGCDANCQVESAAADLCADANPICPGTTTGSTSGVATDGTATCGSSGGSPDVWYQYTPASSGSATFALCSGTGYDSVLSVHSACPGSTANELGCDDDGCGTSGGPSSLTLNVTGGTTYLIRISGWSGAAGAFTLTLTGPACSTAVCGNGTVESGETCDPPNGTTCDATCHTIVCEVPLFEDHFATDLGWTVQNVSVTGGAWERGDPAGAGDRGDPLDDYDGGGACYLTQNAAGNTDVDGGPTHLISPALDLSAGNITLHYAYWYYDSVADAGDSLTVAVSTDNGQNWTALATHQSSAQAWRTDTVRIDDFVTPTATTRLRFSATDNPNNSVVEAAVDAVVLARRCSDCNSNGIDDTTDLGAGTSPDCNSNGVPDECDLAVGTSADCDGGPVGAATAGATIFGTSCFACHNVDGSGGPGYPGPNLRNHSRVQIWSMLLPPTSHPGGAHPEFTQQDFADLEAFLADAGSRGRPDFVPDECQAPADCDTNGQADGCDLEAGTLLDLDYDGIPDACQAAPGDCDADGDVDLTDYAGLAGCLLGPDGGLGGGCACYDLDASESVDLRDLAAFTVGFTGG